METLRSLKIKQLIFSLIACTFIPTLIVVVYSYWQKLVRIIGEIVENNPPMALIWNILQIALALALLLGVAWIIRKVMSYLKTERGPRRDIDSGNLAIAIVVAFLSSLVIIGISGIFTNPVTNIVRILLSFIDDPSVTDATYLYDESYLSPMKASVMMFTNMALFCWTAFWSFTFILGIVEDLRGETPSATKAELFRQKLRRNRRDWEDTRPLLSKTIGQVPEASVSPAAQNQKEPGQSVILHPQKSEASTIPADHSPLNPHLNATDSRLRALVEANEKVQREDGQTED